MSAPRPRWFRPVLAGTVLSVAVFWIVVVTIGTQRAREAAQRTTCYGNYKGLIIAHMLEKEQHGRGFAAWTVDDDGDMLLSWRVSVLPWLSEDSRFASFDHSKPWDHSTNLQVLAASRCPRMFGCPSQQDYHTEFTQKAAVTGPGTVFPGSEPMQFDDIPDGASNTAWAGEISFRLPWTKPEDVEALRHLSLEGPDGFSGPHDGVPFSFCDGSSRFLSRNIDPDVLRQLFLRADESAEPPQE